VLVKLAEIAETQGNLEEAIAYYQQAVVINDLLSPRFYHLAELLLKVNQPDIAREAIESALDLEPKNPKYLDLLIEIAILLSDKKMALDTYNELRLVNPENQKLDSFKSRINEL
jgi:tetratricopeptide (TPR) repeat protein